MDQTRNATNNRCRWVLKKIPPINHEDDDGEENDFDDEEDDEFIDNDDDEDNDEYEDDNDGMNPMSYRSRKHQRTVHRKWKQRPTKLKRSDFNDHFEMIV